MRAASVNFPDTLIVRGLYQMRPEPPFVPGTEAAGVVTEVGDEIDTVAVGDRVMTLPGVGAFAEEIVASPPMQQVHRIPASMPFDEAAAFNITYGTAAHGLIERGHLRAGETVLVNGAAGGCGSAAIEIAKAVGADVIAVAGGADKTALAARLGADSVIDHTELVGDRALSQAVRERTGGEGVQVVFDNVGADTRDLIRCLAWNGRFLVVGFAGGEIPTVPLNLTILKSIAVVGVAYGAVRTRRSRGQPGAVRPAVRVVRGRFVAAPYRRPVPARSNRRRAGRAAGPTSHGKGRHRGQPRLTTDRGGVDDEKDPSRCTRCGRRAGRGVVVHEEQQRRRDRLRAGGHDERG